MRICAWLALRTPRVVADLGGASFSADGPMPVVTHSGWCLRVIADGDR